MLPRHAFLKFVPRRAAATLQRLQSGIWQVIGRPAVFADSADHDETPLALPHWWGRLYQQQGFRLAMPDAHIVGSSPLWLRWEDQAEATLYVDQQPYFGFDPAHRECLLPDTFESLQINSHCVQSAIWHPSATGLDPQGSRLDGACYLRRSDLHWKLYHDLLVLLELLASCLRQDLPNSEQLYSPKGLLPELTSIRPLTRQLLRQIDEAVDCLETRGPVEMSGRLDAIYRSCPSEPWNLDAILTGHAHIDLVWLWPEAIGEVKAVHTFANVDYLMARYADCRFGYSQPASYDAVARREPQLAARTSRRQAEGRWEALGALYVESDTLVPCGEALARSFELGQTGFTQLNEKPSETLWLPDAFGYSGSIPQLMGHYGVKYFFTNKLTWNDTVSFPHTSFRWIGTDGSEVLAFIQPETVQSYNGTLTVPELERAQNRHQQSDTHPETLIPTGFGDGGGGPTAEMCERARRLQNLATVPRCRWDSILGFYERLDARRDKLPTYHGEIMLQFHRGTYTSRSSFKAAYRQLERNLQLAELVATARSLGPIDAHAWRRLVFSQFHDILPGSSVNAAYREIDTEFAALNDAVTATTTARLAGPCANQWFNPTPFPQRHWLGDRVLSLPAYGSLPEEAAQPANEPDIEASTCRLATPAFAAEFNEQGEISAFSFSGRTVPIESPLNQIWLYPNRPHAFDAWEIDRQALSLGRAATGPAEVSLQRPHHGVAELSFQRSLGEHSRLRITYRADTLRNHLEIAYDIDWQEEESLLKAVFPTRYRGDQARFGQACGSVLRRQNPQTLGDEAAWELPASRWVLVSDDGEQEGLSVVTENRYGFTVRHGTVGVSLLSSPLTTGEGSKFARAFPRSLRDDLPDSPFADLGHHTFRILLAPWQAAVTPAAAHPAALADYAFTAPVPHTLQNLNTPALGLTGCDSVMISWIQPVVNGCIVKTIETMGRRGRARLLLAPGKSATPVDGLHHPIGSARSDGEFEVHPYRLSAFLVN